VAEVGEQGRHRMATCPDDPQRPISRSFVPCRTRKRMKRLSCSLSYSSPAS